MASIRTCFRVLCLLAFGPLELPRRHLVCSPGWTHFSPLGQNCVGFARYQLDHLMAFRLCRIGSRGPSPPTYLSSCQSSHFWALFIFHHPLCSYQRTPFCRHFRLSNLFTHGKCLRFLRKLCFIFFWIFLIHFWVWTLKDPYLAVPPSIYSEKIINSVAAQHA